LASERIEACRIGPFDHFAFQNINVLTCDQFLTDTEAVGGGRRHLIDIQGGGASSLLLIKHSVLSGPDRLLESSGWP
jgi:hypothetical protein